jgi:hypothetical protein
VPRPHHVRHPEDTTALSPESVRRFYDRFSTLQDTQAFYEVGGCRPIALTDTLTVLGWQIQHQATITAWGLPSEVVVAQRAP